MPLELSQIKERLLKPEQQSLIRIAAAHQNRLRFHSEAELTSYHKNPAARAFLGWVKELISDEKYKTFQSLLKNPVRSIELTEQIYQQLERVFEGKDPVKRYVFANPDLDQDWQDYRKSSLKWSDFWRSKAFQVMKIMINSIMVVDMPGEQTAERPEPYGYFLDVEKVIDFECDKELNFKWIIFKQSKTEVAVFDDTTLRLFEVDERDKTRVTLIDERPHDLGYCPARFFWTDYINARQKEVKRSPISNQLTDLDWYLFFSVSKQHLDLYAAYPIYSAYDSDCDYVDDAGNYCSGGYLKNADGNPIIVTNADREMISAECPQCKASKLTGPGTFVRVPVPDEDQEDLRDPVQIKPAPIETLNYNVQEVERLWNAIYQATTGDGGESINDKAVNEKQVTALFETKTQILRNLAKNFEAAEQWMGKTICKLRYGQLFESCSISYGTSFYLFSPEYLLEMYETGKSAGWDHATLDMVQSEYYETKYKNNPEQLERVMILLNLDPFRHMTKQDVNDLAGAGLIDPAQRMLKLNFSSLIARFERENIGLVQFGAALEFDKKIQTIQETLIQYVAIPDNTGSADENIKDLLDAYGVGVRAGAITAQQQDEEFFRAKIGAPLLSAEAIEAWRDEGVRRPITLKSQEQIDSELGIAPQRRNEDNNQ